MYSFTYNGIICLLEDVINLKNGPFHIPGTIKNENNRFYKKVATEQKELSKRIDPEMIVEEKKATKPELTITSFKYFLKITKKSLNSNN